MTRLHQLEDGEYICEKCTKALESLIEADIGITGSGNIVTHSKDFPCPLENEVPK